MQYKEGQKRGGKLLKRVLVSLGLLLVILIVSATLIYRQYNDALKPVSDDQTEVTVTIDQGSGIHDIATVLKEKGVIRKVSAFEWYIRLENVGDLQAGTYKLRPNMSVAEIVGILETGKIATDLITILPGKTLAEITQGFVKSGFSEQEVEAALNPSLYTGHPALADSPDITSLEGYLYPETFHKTAATTAQQVITASLDEMNKKLTAEIRSGIKARGLSVHEGIILASLIENEISGTGTQEEVTDKKQVAQVFLKRLGIGMMLQSNATDNYPDDFDTYRIAGLPPAPLTNVSYASFEAVANPAATDYLYFATGADCITRFSRDITSHEQIVEEHGLSTQSNRCN